MIKNLNKKKEITGFLLILSFIVGSVQISGFSQQNLIISNRNGSRAEYVNNPKIATTVQPDWEIVTGTSAISTIIDKPSGVQDGDLLILHGTIDGAGQPFNDPIGWNELLPEYSSNGITVASWYKIAGASEPLNYSVSWNGGNEAYVIGIIRITGYDKNDPFQTNSTAYGTGDIINPSITTTQDNTLVIGFHGRDTNVNIPGNNYGYLLESGPTVLYANTSGPSGSFGMCCAGMYYEIQTNPGVTPTRTWDINTTWPWYAATIAINSPPSGINILDPNENEVFGVIAPNFTVEVSVPDLDTMWYTVDGGLNNYVFDTNGTINQEAWDKLSDGVVHIQFYANNTVGEIKTEQVNVIKDTSAPVINIISPVENEIFRVDPPSFVVEIEDLSLDTMWYSIFNSTHHSLNITFIDNGTIDSTEWNALSDGTYTIRFYANDSLGNINFEDINIIKDFNAIIINIVSPTENEAFGVSAPSFIVEFSKAYLNTTWYSLDGGINNYIFINNGTINQEAWYGLSDGIVTIQFYANNTLGDIYFKQVNVIKDSSAPTINIVSPIENEVFAIKPPQFIVEIIDPNLDIMWYSIFNNTHQSINITFTANGTINQAEWDAFLNGIITIRFYANDTLGNIDFEDVNVTKDIYAIFIDIISPIENQVFKSTAPSFNVEIICAFLNTTWYSLDSGIHNYVFTENGTINQDAWDTLPDGIIIIYFYANNTLGDIKFEHVNVIKDTTDPTINIVSPSENEIFEDEAPNFVIEIVDPNLDTMWYTINNVDIRYIFTQNSTINQARWDSLTVGNVLLIFYANDTVGNLASDYVIVIKSSPSQAGQPGLDPTLIIIIASVIGGAAAIGITLAILIKKGKIKLFSSREKGITGKVPE